MINDRSSLLTSLSKKNVNWNHLPIVNIGHWPKNILLDLLGFSSLFWNNSIFHFTRHYYTSNQYIQINQSVNRQTGYLTFVCASCTVHCVCCGRSLKFIHCLVATNMQTNPYVYCTAELQIRVGRERERQWERGMSVFRHLIERALHSKFNCKIDDLFCYINSICIRLSEFATTTF